MIELLAVIVILAIIALIATPIILNIIKDTKIESKKISVQNYLEAVELAIARENMNGEFKPTQCEIINKGLSLNCEGYDDPLVIELDGEKPTKGKIKLNEGKVSKDIYLIYNEYGISMNENGELQQFSKPKSFASDSWDTIVKNVRAGNISKYNLGDTKEVKLEGFENTSEEEGTYTLRIANTSTPEECNSQDFSQTACGFVIEFEDIITLYHMNPEGEYKGVQYEWGWNVDGYPASSMYTYIKNDIYALLPEDLKEVIIDTKVVSSHGSTKGEMNFTSTDKLYLLSTKEVYGKEGTSKEITGDTAEKETRQLGYYKDVAKVTTTSYSKASKKYNGASRTWWLRSAVSNKTYQFYCVYNGGEWNNLGPSRTNGVAPAFRIG